MQITTKSKHIIVLCDEVTGRQARKIRFSRGQLVQYDEGTGAIKMAGIEASEQYENSKISAIVKSVDGNMDNVVDAVCDLPDHDYVEIMDGVDKILEGDNEKKEKAGASLSN